MITRIYLAKWQIRNAVEGDEDSRFVWNPMLDVINEMAGVSETLNRDQRPRVSFEYPSRLADGSPSKPAIVIIVTAESIPDDWALLDGVYMFPPHALGHRIDDIPDEIKEGVIDSLADFGVSYSDITGADTVADFIDKIENSLLSVSKPTADRFIGRAGDFA